tara:strand:- start:179 stop:844 length:666 start_codon:yes stop_codon:yes gene_type:complete
MKGLVIVGLGETAELAHQYFTYDSSYKVSAFSVDAEYINSEKFLNLPVVAIEKLSESYHPNEYEAFVAISATKMNRYRSEIYKRIKNQGYKLATYVSSKAFLWNNTVVGENCFILENNTLQPFTRIGNNVIIWSGNHIGHRTVIEDNCFISSHCVISGFCKIGNSSFLGVNCTLEDGVVVEEDTFVGAGAIIRKSTDIKSVYQAPATAKAKIDSHKLFKIK